MDKFNDFYGEPNYTRIFLLFFLFLAAMFYWMSNDIYSHFDTYQYDTVSLVEGICEGDEVCVKNIT